MRKPFSEKITAVTDAADDVRETARKIGEAAQSQATLNIALTGVAVAALLVCTLLVLGSDDRGR